MIRWIRQFWAVAKNAFVVSLGDPVYLIMLLSVLTLMALLGSLPTFAFGQEMRLMRDQCMALVFLSGCGVAVIGVVLVVARDLSQGGVAVLMSRPISSLGVITGKWVGLAGALLVYTLPVSLAALWMTKIAVLAGTSSEDQELDVLALSLYFLSIVVALGAMAAKHYLFGGWYVWQANVAVCVCFTVGFLISGALSTGGHFQPYGTGMDWPSSQGCLLLFLAVLIFAGMLFPVAVQADTAVVLVAALLIFGVGTLSEYGISQVFHQPSVLRYLAKALLPNWQTFWISDVLDNEQLVSWRYVLGCVIHAAAYITACLSLATWLFNRRELSGTDVL